MKISAFLIAAVAAEKKHPTPFNHPEYRVNQLSDHVDFIFGHWMGNCASSTKHGKRTEKLQKNLKGFLGRMLSYFNRCSARNGGGAEGDMPDFNPDSDNGFRKRRNVDDERLNQKDPATAIKQLSDGAVKHWIVKFADRYGCNDGDKRKTYFHNDEPDSPRWYVKLQKMGLKTAKLHEKCGTF